MYRQGVPYIWMASAPENVGLAPIVSRQYGGGADIEPKRWLRIGAEAFDKRYHNYPVDPAIPSRVLVSSSADFDSPYVGPLISAGEVHAKGVDTVATMSAGAALQVTANYSYWQVSQLGLDDTWRAAEHELRHQGRVELMFRPAVHALRRQGIDQGGPGRLRSHSDQHARLPGLPARRRPRRRRLRGRPHGDENVFRGR